MLTKDEDQLAVYCVSMADMGFGLNCRELCYRELFSIAVIVAG